MSEDLESIHPIPVTSALGDRIRTLTSQLRQERDVQIKATSRILGAAAQMAVNHDRLIDQVVEMAETDLDQQSQLPSSEPYTVASLKQRFKSIKEAKAHFNLKASGWDDLVTKLNTPPAPATAPVQKGMTQEIVAQRLEAVEQELQLLRADMNQVLNLLTVLIENQSTPCA